MSDDYENPFSRRAARRRYAEQGGLMGRRVIRDATGKLIGFEGPPSIAELEDMEKSADKK